MAYCIALIHKQPDSGISFPDVPGVIAVADTLNEAMREAPIVLGFAFEDWSGEHPVPRTRDALRQDKEFWDLPVDAVVAAVMRAPSLANGA